MAYSEVRHISDEFGNTYILDEDGELEYEGELTFSNVDELEDLGNKLVKDAKHLREAFKDMTGEQVP